MFRLWGFAVFGLGFRVWGLVQGVCGYWVRGYAGMGAFGCLVLGFTASYLWLGASFGFLRLVA